MKKIVDGKEVVVSALEAQAVLDRRSALAPEITALREKASSRHNGSDMERLLLALSDAVLAIDESRPINVGNKADIASYSSMIKNKIQDPGV